MTPYEAEQVNQERCEQQQIAAESLFFDGAADARSGVLPELKDPIYIDGYITELQTFPTDADNRIIYPNAQQFLPPQRQFAFGYVDGIGNAIDGEENI